MTEKTELLKSAIDEIDRVLLGNKSADVNEVYLNNAKRFISESMQDTNTPFTVGEYYVTNGLTFKVIAGDQTLFLINGALVKSSRSLKDDTFKNSKPATTEQIATFRRAEQFASKGREWSEFKKGDIVQNTKTMQLGLVESVDEDGDVWVNYNMDVPLIYPNYLKCTGALFLNLIQTAEELQEVGKS